MSKLMHKPIPYGRQTIDDSDIDAVRQALGQDFLTQGPTVGAFESEMKASQPYHTRLPCRPLPQPCTWPTKGLDLDVGNSLWTSPITFVSTANAARLCGAGVDLVDIDASTGNMCPQKLEDKLGRSAKNNTLPNLLCRSTSVVPVVIWKQSDTHVTNMKLMWSKTHHTPWGASIKANRLDPVSSQTPPFLVSIRSR